MKAIKVKEQSGIIREKGKGGDTAEGGHDSKRSGWENGVEVANASRVGSENRKIKTLEDKAPGGTLKRVGRPRAGGNTEFNGAKNVKRYHAEVRGMPGDPTPYTAYSWLLKFCLQKKCGPSAVKFRGAITLLKGKGEQVRLDKRV